MHLVSILKTLSLSDLTSSFLANIFSRGQNLTGPVRKNAKTNKKQDWQKVPVGQIIMVECVKGRREGRGTTPPTVQGLSVNLAVCFPAPPSCIDTQNTGHQDTQLQEYNSCRCCYNNRKCCTQNLLFTFLTLYIH